MSDNAPQRPGFFSWGMSVLAGVCSAVIIGFAVSHAGSILILLAYLSSIPLFITGLAAGAAAGTLAALSGSLCLIAVAPREVALFYLIAVSIPGIVLIWLTTHRKRSSEGAPQWFSQGTLVTFMVAYPCLIFLGIYAALAKSDGGLLQITIDAFASVKGQVTNLLTQQGQPLTPEVAGHFDQMMKDAARVAPALSMSAWLLATLMSLIISHYVLSRWKLNLRPDLALANLTTPLWMLLIFLACASFCLAAKAEQIYIPLNLAIVLGVPFFLTGLSVIHALAAQTRAPTVILILLYIILSVVPYLAPLPVILGVLDRLMGVRQRLVARAVLIQPKQGDIK